MCHGCSFLLLELEWCGAARRAMPDGPGRATAWRKRFARVSGDRTPDFKGRRAAPGYDARRTAESI
ncbi:hypothetical protein L810_6421 [Burkholderia sp. AU4i]|nr:hypothetical protein L810_6421 [Burkholderia sp. AU4i]